MRAFRVHAFLEDRLGRFAGSPVEIARTLHGPADQSKNCFDERIRDPKPRSVPPVLRKKIPESKRSLLDGQGRGLLGLVCVLLPVLMLVPAGSRAAVTIDTLISDPFEIHSEGDWVYHDTGGYPVDQVIGGHRRVGVDATTGNAATVRVTAGREATLLGGGYLSLIYGSESPLHLNLLGDGLSVMVIHLRWSAPDSLRAPFFVRLQDSSRRDDQYFTFGSAAGEELLEVPLDGFRGVRLENIQQIELGFIRMGADASGTVMGAWLVPEPGSCLLAGIGVAGLLFGRRSPSRW